MIRLEVAAAPPRRSPREQVDYSRWVDSLAADPRFGELLSRTSDEIVHEWAHGVTTPQSREDMYHTLQGLQRLMREMQKEIEHGVAAARELEDEARHEGDGQRPTT